MTRARSPRRWKYGAVGGRVVSTVWTTPRRSSARVSSAVWFCIPPMGSNFTPLPTSAEGGDSKTEQSLSTPSRVRSLPLISQEPPEEPLAANADRTPLHTTLIVPSRAAGEMRGRVRSQAPPQETAVAPKEKARRSAGVGVQGTLAATGLENVRVLDIFLDPVALLILLVFLLDGAPSDPVGAVLLAVLILRGVEGFLVDLLGVLWGGCS